MSLDTQTRYHPSAEQLALGESMSGALREVLPFSRLHVSTQESAATWYALEDIGIFKIGLSEALGGSGLGAVEEALIVTQLGSRLASPAILATLAAAPSCEDAAELRGSRTAAAFRKGVRCIIVAEADAALILLRDLKGAALHRWPAAALEAVDDRLWLGTLREATEADEPLALFNERELARLRLIDAAALAGMAQATLDMSVAYAAAREQFGRPIGSFQAIKHHCANMAIRARCARDQTNFAAVALDEGRGDAQLQVECALLVAGTAALENASKNIQLHGAMGFSDEADPHLFLKRAQLQLAIAGGLDAATARIASLEGET
jgi:alkylation response protein AidB-like acyl-CoA dehydrogenase